MTIDPGKFAHAVSRAPWPSKIPPDVRGRWVRWLRGAPCADCAGVFPWYVMQFDHMRGKRSHGRKSMGALASNGTGWATILRELAKTELVCANCHAIRTWKRSSTARTRKG